MNNIEQMLKAQELIYSNTDKLESIITAIESVLSPTIGDRNTVVAPEEEKAPKRWWEDYTWGEKDMGSLVMDANGSLYLLPDWAVLPLQAVTPVHDTKLHFKPWIAKEGKIPEDLGEFIAILWQDGEIEVAKVEDLDLECVFSPASDADFFHLEVVGYCNLTFVNPILGE